MEHRRFIPAFTSARCLSPPHPPRPTSWRSILILSFHLSLGLPSGLRPSGFPTKTVYTPLLSPIRAIWTAHLILSDFVVRTIFGEQYRSFISALCSFLHSHVTSSLGTFVLHCAKTIRYLMLQDFWIHIFKFACKYVTCILMGVIFSGAVHQFGHRMQ
jgi:hypothetical protein